MRTRKGFTLIELSIVVAAILIIAAIALPRMLRSRLSAEEVSAVATMRTISTVQAQVRAQNLFPDPISGTAMYATFEQMSTLNPPVLDAVLTGGNHVKSGYRFELDLATQTPSEADFNAYALKANQTTDLRNFFIDPAGVIHYTRDNSRPGINSPTL